MNPQNPVMQWGMTPVVLQSIAPGQGSVMQPVVLPIAQVTNSLPVSPAQSVFVIPQQSRGEEHLASDSKPFDRPAVLPASPLPLGMFKNVGPDAQVAPQQSDTSSDELELVVKPRVATGDDLPPPLVDTTETSREGCDAYTYVVELRHGRKRIAAADTMFSRGAHALLSSSKGNEIATVKKLIHSRKRDAGSRMRVVREVSQKEFDAFTTECQQEEAGALKVARKLVTQLGVPLNIHCVSMQQGRSRFTFHYTSRQAHPDFRRLVNDLSSSLRVSVWFNNCSPAPGCPGDKIAPCHMTS